MGAAMTQDQFKAEIMRRAEYAAARVGAEVVADLKKVLSVPAEIVPGSRPPRAATKATPGAPPRKITGAGRSGTTFVVERNDANNQVILYVGNNVIYMGALEFRDHPWFFKNIATDEMVRQFQLYFDQAGKAGIE
jgi:hypothetical protein